jgi:hypothetical protein
MYTSDWNEVAVRLEPPESLRIDVENIEPGDDTCRNSPQAIWESSLPKRDLSRISGCGLKPTSDQGALVGAARKPGKFFEREVGCEGCTRAVQP